MSNGGSRTLKIKTVKDDRQVNHIWCRDLDSCQYFISKKNVMEEDDVLSFGRAPLALFIVSYCHKHSSDRNVLLANRRKEGFDSSSRGMLLSTRSSSCDNSQRKILTQGHLTSQDNKSVLGTIFSFFFGFVFHRGFSFNKSCVCFFNFLWLTFVSY